MSLQTRLEAFVAAVGADIKDLRSKVAPIAVSQENWHTVGAAGEPAFQNGWTNYGAGETSMSFRKDPGGRVQMRGVIKGGAINTTIMQLPGGYRPDISVGFARFPVMGGSAPGQIYIDSAGLVKYNTGDPSFVDVVSVEFDTGQMTWPAGKSIIPIVTALPVGATDSQEVYLEVDKASLYGGPFLWHCRYSNAYFKPAGVWHVLGDPARLRVEGVGGRDWNVHEQTASLNAAQLPTPGPAITVPFAGTYDVTGRALSILTGGGAPSMFLWKTGDGGPSWIAGDSLVYAGPNAGMMDQMSAEREFALAAGDSIELRYATSNTGFPTQFYNRNIYLRPIRLNA